MKSNIDVSFLYIKIDKSASNKTFYKNGSLNLSVMSTSIILACLREVRLQAADKL